MILRFAFGAAAFVALIGAAACGRKAAPTPEGASVQARDVFANRCATCHGEDGRGDGPAARALSVKPRDYTSAAWQASVKDDDIRRAISGGGPAVGKSNVMPANKDLDPAVVDALVRIVRGFGSGG